MSLNQSGTKSITVKAMISSKFFKRGVADYFEGRWSEVTGNWYSLSAAHLYEKGRLVAAVNQSRAIGVSQYVAAMNAGAFAPTAKK